jgi:hypothetical protein
MILISCSSSKTRVVQLEYQQNDCKIEKLTRVYLNDSIFIEHTQSNETHRIDTFKTVGNSWFVKKCGKFQLYFDVSGFRNKDTIYQLDNTCQPILKLIPQKEDTVDNKVLFKFKVEDQHYNYFAPTVWFDPGLGIVKVISKTGDCDESNLKIISDDFLDSNALNKLGLKK